MKGRAAQDPEGDWLPAGARTDLHSRSVGAVSAGCRQAHAPTACTGGSVVEVVVQINFIEVMPPSEMELLRQKFDHLEADRENKKFISQEINLHFTHR